VTIAEGFHVVHEELWDLAHSEAYENLLLIGVAPTAALLSVHQATQTTLAGMAVSAGAVVSAMPEGSGPIIGSLTLNTLSDRSMPTARWRVKITQDMKVRLSAVKRVGNNKFLVPGSRASGTPAKSFAAPVFKGIGRVFGVASLAGHLNELANESSSIGRIRLRALSASDFVGLLSGVAPPLTTPLRLVPALAGAVDLFSQKAAQSWYGIPDG
jgi:hypothetical protein